MSSLLDLVAPIRCVACGVVADGELCAACAERVQVVRRPRCDRCGAPCRTVGAKSCAGCEHLEAFGRARSLVVFAEPARALTLALKRKGRRALVAVVGGLIAELAAHEGLFGAGEVVAFVPAGRGAKKPGFDHSLLLAAATARALGAPLDKALVRVADGPRQADVPFAQRRQNVRDRFAARPIAGRVLLVDDVFTTGSTAEVCARALLDAGAESVDVVTWARTLRRLPRRP